MKKYFIILSFFFLPHLAGATPVITITPENVNFGNIIVGDTSSIVPVTISATFDIDDDGCIDVENSGGCGINLYGDTLIVWENPENTIGYTLKNFDIREIGVTPWTDITNGIGLYTPTSSTETTLTFTLITEIRVHPFIFSRSDQYHSWNVNDPAPLGGVNVILYVNAENQDETLATDQASAQWITVAVPSAPANFQFVADDVASSFASNVTASVGSTLSNAWGLVFIAIALPLTFWTLYNIADLFPAMDKKRRWKIKK